MNRYFVTCARGLEPLLVRELAALGAAGVAPGRGGVYFEGGPAIVYRASLWLRTAVRILRPVLEADVRTPDELYEAVRSILWSEYMTPDHTLAVDCNARNSGITHSQYASRRVKDAICDQFRERVGRRPSVDTERPSIGLNLHIANDHAILSLDASWDSLHKRGYRPIQTRAPLNEALAAGLLMQCGYDGSVPLYDPMCGSGTFAIEGSWIALDRPPGLTRKWFGFFGWMDFDKGLWSAIREDARRSVKAALAHPAGGSDVRQDAIDFACGNARAAGVGHLLSFERLALKQVRPPPVYHPAYSSATRPTASGSAKKKNWSRCTSRSETQ
ncbi:THUMP domain-containing class I SAM-dependent RNA methyltransferase [Fimbriiglobus ruber]|uniref:Methyltransferase n=1 Tax=Fimbriiglobus ruber TaxID=1908690 RepID=A0A225D3R6_9BACT|nr:THUMP domain-containing protein [Fimbriiglobus ruber]OWK36142.1 Methyltransferase [Fimbriiglobus ruber]